MDGKFLKISSIRPCPRCDLPLVKRNTKKGNIQYCTNCSGSFYHRSYIFSNKHSKLISLINSNLEKSPNVLNIKCPNCQLTMQQIVYTFKNEDIILDVCPSCKGLWFDAFESKILNDTSPSQNKITVLNQFLKIPRNIHDRDLEKIINSIKKTNSQHDKDIPPQSSQEKYIPDFYSIAIVIILATLTIMNLILDMSLQKQLIGIIISMAFSYIIKFIIKVLRDVFGKIKDRKL